jgi:hypothetical protein
MEPTLNQHGASTATEKKDSPSPPFNIILAVVSRCGRRRGRRKIDEEEEEKDGVNRSQLNQR